VCGAEPVGYPVPAQGRTVVEPDVLEGLRTPRTRALVVNSPSDPTAGGLEPPRSSGCSGGPPGTTSGWSPTGAPFYLWLAYRDPRPSAQLARDLVLEPGVTLEPRDAFGPAGAGHLRVSLATATQPLVEGLSRVVAALG
jgi:aspartate/methionine/tyrosine aminotransferase